MKTNEEIRKQDINDKKWYQSAKLPWGIILTVLLIFSGFVGGWVVRGDMNQRIDNEVVKRFEGSKTNQ